MTFSHTTKKTIISLLDIFHKSFDNSLSFGNFTLLKPNFGSSIVFSQKRDYERLFKEHLMWMYVRLSFYAHTTYTSCSIIATNMVSKEIHKKMITKYSKYSTLFHWWVSIFLCDPFMLNATGLIRYV